MKTFVVDLPDYLDKRVRQSLSPNGRVGWARRQRVTRTVRTAAFYEFLRLLPLGTKLSAVRATMSVQASFPSAALMDDDNVWAMLKPARDGIADLLWPDKPKARADEDISAGTIAMENGRSLPYFRLVVEVYESEDRG